MIEKPDLNETAALACLRELYGIPARCLEFLPIGNDASGWAYRVHLSQPEPAAGAPGSCFLKVKRSAPDPAALSVPWFLRQEGIEEVVAPLPNRDSSLWTPLAPYGLVLYPWVEGRSGMEIGLADDQWTAFGVVMARIHAVHLAGDVRKQVKVDHFVPPWSEVVRRVQERVRGGRFASPVETDFARLWLSREAEIARILARTEELGRALRGAAPQRVLCHSDIHTANLIVDPAGGLHVVDWDQPVLAPRERDLMFVAERAGPVQGRGGQEGLFFTGYGEVVIDPLALAYYRYEWVVQEFGDYGQRVFWLEDIGDETRRQSVDMFNELFQPGDVVDGAYQSEGWL